MFGARKSFQNLFLESGVDFWDTTSLQQRFDQPEFQPERMKVEDR